MNTNLTVKDLVKLAIFTVVLYLVIRAASLVSLIPGVYPFTAALTLIPVGVVWMYLRMRVPARFSVLIQGTLLALLAFLGGSPYFIAIGLLVGSAAGELITFRKKDVKPSHRNVLLGYIAFGLIYDASTYPVMVVARDSYVSYVSSLGMPTEFVMNVLSLVSWPTFILGLVAVIPCAFAGIHLGKKVTVRFFKR